jgi:hypothetical protein
MVNGQSAGTSLCGNFNVGGNSDVRGLSAWARVSKMPPPVLRRDHRLPCFFPFLRTARSYGKCNCPGFAERCPAGAKGKRPNIGPKCRYYAMTGRRPLVC